MKKEVTNNTEKNNTVKISLENNKIVENVSLEKVMNALKKLKEQQVNN